jgi:hypothetical protein
MAQMSGLLVDRLFGCFVPEQGVSSTSTLVAREGKPRDHKESELASQFTRVLRSRRA